MASLAEIRKGLARRFTEPVVRLLARTAITPGTITWLGFALALGAMALIITGHPIAAGAVVVIAGLFDMLDGALARYTKRASRFGAMLDSTLDRLSESVVLIGILVFYIEEGQLAPVLLAGIALPSSLLVSYTRARAEALGLECQVGFFTRTERVIILALGLLLSRIPYVLVTAMGIIATLSLVTAGQRLFHVWQQTKSKQEK